MGLTNTILDKRTKCPFCNAGVSKHFIDGRLAWESKEAISRCNVWEFGKKVTLRDGALTFEAKGDTVWSGILGCLVCKKEFQSNIFINNGIITEIRIIPDEDLKCPECGGYGHVNVYMSKTCRGEKTLEKTYHNRICCICCMNVWCKKIEV